MRLEGAVVDRGRWLQAPGSEPGDCNARVGTQARLGINKNPPDGQDLHEEIDSDMSVSVI